MTIQMIDFIVGHPILTLVFAFIGFLIIFFASSYVSDYLFKRYKRRMTEALQPVFPDVNINDDHSIYFQAHTPSHKFRVDIDFSMPSKYSYGYTTFYFRRLNTSKKVEDLCNNIIFEVLFRDRDVFEAKTKDPAVLKKRLKIKADDPILKQNLPNADALLSELGEIYLAAGSPETWLRLEQNSLTIFCGSYIGNPDTVKNVAQSAIKACEQAVKTAARVGIDFTAPSFVQDSRQTKRSLESCSEASLYDSLEDLPGDDSQNIFEDSPVSESSAGSAADKLALRR